jgi:hypothetical protein
MTRHIASACLILLLVPALAFANAAPEIDISAAPAALAALAGILAIVRARRQS